MNVILIGVNHRTAPVNIRERLNIPESRLPEAVAALLRREGIREALILSTCNRVEVLASAEDAADAKAIIEQFLTDYLGFELAPANTAFTTISSRRRCIIYSVWLPVSIRWFWANLKSSDN